MRKLLVLLAIVGLVSWSGCEKKDAEKKGDDKAAEKKGDDKAAEKKGDDKAAEKKGDDKKAAAKPAADMAGKLEGKWSIDMDALLKANPDMKAQMEKPEAKAMMEGMMKSMSFEFGKDSISISMMGKTQKASYKVKKSEGKVVTIESKDEGKDEAEEITITFSDDDHMVMEKKGEKEKMTMVRAK